MTIVHNDPVNLMSYVTYVFQTYFGYSKDKATKLMIDVHHKGRAVVSSGSREEMERDVQAMHGYGLWATLQQDRKLANSLHARTLRGRSPAAARPSRSTRSRSPSCAPSPSSCWS